MLYKMLIFTFLIVFNIGAVNNPKDQAQDMLYKAIINNSSTEDIQNILQAGASVNHQTSDGKTPLLLAALLKRSNLVEFFLKAGAIGGEDSIRYMIKSKDAQSAYLLLKYKVNITNYDSLMADALEYALSVKDKKDDFSIALKLIHKLIMQGYKVDSIWTNSNADYIYYSKDIFEIFLKNGANPNYIIPQTGLYFVKNAMKNPLYIAIEQGSEDAVQLLLNVGANSNVLLVLDSGYRTTTALFKAIETGSLKIVKILLDFGADINLKANPYPADPKIKGLCTPLSFALELGARDQIVELLLKYGANLK